MPDYKKMYAILCAAASDAIDLIGRSQTNDAAQLLQQALTKAEDIYIQSPPSFRKRFGSFCKAALPHLLTFLAAVIVLFLGFVLGGIFVLRGS